MSFDHQFPNTQWSLVLLAQGEDTADRRRAIGEICRTYWLPVYAFARGQGLKPADAEDLTQNVFAHLLEKGAFQEVAAERGTLRSFLRVATKNYMLNEWKKANRHKRGGGAVLVPLDCEAAERLCALEANDEETPDRVFDRHWGMNLLNRTMLRLAATYREDGKAEQFAVLKDALGGQRDGVRYDALAERLDMSPGAVKVAVHRLRRRYGELLRSEIAQTLEDRDAAAVEDELRALFLVFSRP